MSSRYQDADETASQRSGASGASGNSGATSGLGQSETSSQRSDAKFLKRERSSAAEREEGDLLEQKRSIQDGIFSCMYTLVRQAALSSWKFAVLKVVLEGLMGFIVVFNPSISAWNIDVSNPVWQVVRWTVWRSPIVRLYGYKTYIMIMYIMVVAVFLAVLGLVGLTFAMRRQEQSKWLRTASIVLHIVYDVMFIMLYVSFFDYLVFAANCNFTKAQKYHVYFGPSVNCMAMPHILHMSVALVTAVLFFCVTAFMVVASSELNPISRAFLASPVAVARLQILVAKAAYVIVANDLQSWPKPQAVGLVLCVALICWWNFRRLPFYRTAVNTVWCSFWFGILYAACLLAYLAFASDASAEHRRKVTLLVLYGIFPTIAAGCVACAIHAWWAARPAAKFRHLGPGVRLAKVHKFGSVQEVEVLSRVMRKFSTDGTVDEDAAALGETIIKAGMAAFPDSAFLLILHANFLLEVRKDGPASRTQLQQASRHSPTPIERYQIFCTGEASKRLKDSQECGMDLQAYIEFRRNFRAVLRVHKEVLMLQAELWMLMLRTSLRVTEVDRALDGLEAGTVRAHTVYKRVLERYPTNGKLLRCYGKFLEDVRHDPLAAAKAYAEASRNGGGDAILNLDVINIQGSASKPEFLTSMSMEDDAVIVINAEGQIMMVSQAVQKVFGYPKTELEGANVSLLMPQPFCQRHSGYLQRYTGGGEPHILDTVREVVALHKERYVFPMSLCVTRMSGAGTDSIFLGVARPLPPSSLTVRAWLAPNGVLLCGDQQFASLCGMAEGELIGRPLAALVENEVGEVEELLERCRDAPVEEFLARAVRTKLMLRNRYLEPVPVDVTLGLAGTDTQRILVLNCSRTDGREGTLMVVDSHMRLRFASCGLSTLLGYSARKLAAMRLDQLLPPPYNTLHAKYLRDPPAVIPPTSCRAGKVVHLLNENGSLVAVRLKISTAAVTDTAMTLYVVQIEKRPPDELMTEKQLVVTSDFGGRVLSVSQPDSELFGFQSADMVGCNLCDIVDIFQEWRDRAGESQMQLLMLALLDKEHEMPGTSWRVRVHAPIAATSDGSKPHLPRHITSSASKRPSALKTVAPASKSACLQVELYDDVYDQEGGEENNRNQQGDGGPNAATDGFGGGGGSGSGGGGGGGPPSSSAGGGVCSSRIRVTLWRRDLLTGVVELDEELTVRRASPMTGLITGIPSTAMLKKPLQKFLDLPADKSWEKLSEEHSRHRKQRSALKSSGNRGVVSPVMAFIGPHPDTGTMRIIIQGVQVLAPGGRSKIVATLHPDTTFSGAHADLMRVLHLDGALLVAKSARRQHSEARTSIRNGVGGGGGGGGGDGDGDGGDGDGEGDVDVGEGDSDGDGSGSSDGGSGDSCGRRRRRRRRRDSDSSRDLEAEGQATILSRAASKSEFVAQWVRTLTKRLDGSHRSHPGPSSRPTSRPGTSAAAATAAAATHPDAGTGAIAGAGADGADAAAAAFAAGSSASGGGGGSALAPDRRLSTLTSIPENRPVTATATATVTATATAAAAESTMAGALLGTALSRRAGAGGAAPAFGRALSARVGSGGFESRGPWSVSGAAGIRPGSASRQVSRDSDALTVATAAAPVTTTTAAAAVGGGDDGSDGEAGDGGNGGKFEKGSEAGDSSADGSQAASGFTSSTDAGSTSELLLVDSRRSRLLKALTKLLAGPALTTPLERLRLHSYALLAVMLTTHVVAYIVVTSLIAEQHHEVNLVHRQALAMDRSQLIAVRAMMGAFCERPNVTAKVSVCANSLNFTLHKLRENVDLMEKHHQYVYLGDSRTSVVKLMPEVYDIWTSQQLEFHSYMDTATPAILTGTTGAWVLGNRYIAAAREALYWLPTVRHLYRLHRTYHFLVDNGLGPLFSIYARSLDLLVDSAWKSVDRLRTALITLLVVEPLFVQCCCLAYEWVLVQRLERARLVGILAMAGLPGPVLRQLATKEAKVLDDSDDDDDGDSSDGGEEGGDGGGNTSGKEGGGGAAAAAVASASGVAANGADDKMLLLLPGETSTSATAADGEGGAAAAAGNGGNGAPARLLKFLSLKKPATAAAAAEEGEVAAPASPAKGAGRRVRTPPGACAGDDLLGGGRGVRISAGGAGPPPVGGGGGGQADHHQQQQQLQQAREAGKADGGPVGARRASRDGGSNTAAGAPRSHSHAGSTRLRGFNINGKQLVPSATNITKFMLPFALWNIALVVVYVVSLLDLNGMQGPLASLNMASHIIYRYTRVRAIAFGLVSQDDAASRVLWREMLATELRYFESEYDALMYGGTPITQLDSVFQHAVPPSTFASTAFANEFFRYKKCFQYDKAECLKPGDEYYEVTHNGLDVMVRRMLAEMNLLAADADEDVAYYGTRYSYMYKVGANDLYEGLQQAAQLFVDYSNSRYDQVGRLHTILLAVTIVLVLLFLVLVLWPHLARLRVDATRTSALLSHVPPEVDVRSHVRAVFRRAVGVGKRSGRNSGGGSGGSGGGGAADSASGGGVRVSGSGAADAVGARLFGGGQQAAAAAAAASSVPAGSKAGV
ncbi:hypothetical protein PLESTF_001365300 [Pleodorina starrii]|nr:hypothetical protein PLESTF_001365300 [Pleodorina starrii]